MSDCTAFLGDLVALAHAKGADAADAMLVESLTLSVSRRLGVLEEVERAESTALGLRVFLGRRSAIVAATALDPGRFGEMVERALAMARVVPEDPFAGLAEADASGDDPVLDLDDGSEPPVEALIARATAAEEAALAVPGVTNSEGVSASFSRSRIWLATSAGFAGGFSVTNHGVWAVALAGEGSAMQRDYEFSTAVHETDLEDTETIGRRAGERAVRRLYPKRPPTERLPVMFEPRVAASLLSHLAGAINGAAVAQGTSFLREKLGQRVFAPGVSVIDDPFCPRGLASRPFDGEARRGGRLAVVEDGVLCSWLLDTRFARQLKLSSTGHASRSPASQPTPAPSNLYLAPGRLGVEALIAETAEGFLVTELLGSAVNLITGDYSRGAAGFMIRNGMLAEPVAEITIAGNLFEMFARLTPADDLAFRRRINAPTCRIDAMTLAGA